MGKIFTTTDGKKIERISRYIQIRTDYVTKKHSLYDYADKSDNDALLNYFIYQGRKYAINQFVKYGSAFFPTSYQFMENGKLNFLSGVDSENFFNPLLIEIDEYGERVRVYQELNQ